MSSNSQHVADSPTRLGNIVTDTAEQTAADPFANLQALRLDQSFGSVGVKKALLLIPVKKPDKTWFVRVRPDPAYQLDTCVIELKEDNELYLVSPALWSALAEESTLSPVSIFTAINRQGVIFLWPATGYRGRRGCKIDGVSAMVTALAQVKREQMQPTVKASVYESRGIFAI